MKPVVLFVHGAWHSPIHFGPICSLLQKYGYKTSCPRLPTAGGSIHAGLPEDAEKIAAELERLLACGADVFLVGHSYGGVVITDAVLPEHTKTARAAKGLQGGVVHILYLSALLLPPGQTISDVLGGQLPPFLSIDVRTALFCELHII
jgi:pimeloyl-ACP methyl ester carboxylesterase